MQNAAGGCVILSAWTNGGGTAAQAQAKQTKGEAIKMKTMREVFGVEKPIIRMLHLAGYSRESAPENA